MNYKMNRLLRVMLIICITILLSVHNLCAQEVWEELVEQLMDEDENSSFQWDTHFEELSELRENPININTATKEQLERFPFLSDQLVENILYYLYKYGPMLTRNELWMIEDIDLFIFDEPTRGIDIGAKSEIYQLIRNLAENGCAVMFISSEMPEIIADCDKIVVMNGGNLMGILDKEGITQEKIMTLAAGLEA